MLSISNSTVTNWVSPLHHCQNQPSLNQINGFISLRKSSKSLIVSSYADASSTQTLARNSLKPSTREHDIEIRRFCDMGNLEKAMDLISQLKRSKLELELATYCSVLQLCAELKSLHNGRKVHSIIESNGVEINGVLGSKLVFMYVICGDLNQGRRVFDTIANDKVFLWNLLINEYAKNGYYDEGINLYTKMQYFSVGPNAHTFTSILKCFYAKGCVIEGERVHGYLLKLGFNNADTAVINSLIAFYFKCGRTETAYKVFDKMIERDLITWNSMISGYIENNFGEKGVNIFIQMLNLGIIVDLITILNVLAACAKIRVIKLGKAVHAYAIKSGFQKDASFKNTLLDMYSKSGDIDSAAQIFQAMTERSVVTWTSMISGYTQHGLFDKALLLFDEMKKHGIKLDYFVVTCVLHACACSGSLEKGKEVYNYIKEHNMQLNLYVSNALVDMYAKCGSMEEANSIFSHTPIKDIVSWNTMIGGYSKNNFPNHALNLFKKMQKELKPDSVTIACVLPVCASLGALDKGREIHCYLLRNFIFEIAHVDNALVDMYAKCGAINRARSLFDIIPRKDLVTWTVMIAGYAMNGEGNEAISLFSEMKRASIEPDKVSFVSILRACSHSRLVDVGLRFYNIMRNNSNIEPNLEHYACIVDLLAKSGKLSMAYEFIEKMPAQPNATIWGSLLRGCKIHHAVNLAEKVADRVFELEPNNTEYYLILADIYAEAQKREMAKKSEKRGWRSLKKNPSWG